jgi:hypothetical protein
MIGLRTGWGWRGRGRVAAIVAVGAATVAALVGVARVEAGGSATLSIGLAPGSVTAGTDALAVATFTNNGPSTLSHVLVTLTFSSSVELVSAPGCTPASGTATTLSCALGNLHKGVVQQIIITYVVPNASTTLTVNGTATWAAGTQSNGNGGSGDTVSAASSPAIVFAAGDPSNSSNCLATPQTLTATGSLTTSEGSEQQTTQLPSPPKVAGSLGLPCTPLSVGVGPNPGGGHDTDVAIVDVPQLTTPATVVLNFPDEALPNEGVPGTAQTIAAIGACSGGSLPPAPVINNLDGNTASNDNPNYLQEFASGDSGATRTVCGCANNGTAVPAGQDSCIVSVTSTDTDEDFDTGTITLLVQGNGLGDPAYVG